MAILDSVGDVASSAGGKIGSGAAIGGAIGTVVPVVGTAIGTVVGAVTGYISSLFTNSTAANHDHQKAIAAQWNRGDHVGAVGYFQSWIDGVGRQEKGHVSGLLDSYNKAIKSGLQTDVDYHNGYLTSVLSGVYSPIPVDLLTQYNGVTYLKYVSPVNQTGNANPTSSSSNSTLSSLVSTSNSNVFIWILAGIVGIIALFKLFK